MKFLVSVKVGPFSLLFLCVASALPVFPGILSVVCTIRLVRFLPCKVPHKNYLSVSVHVFLC